MVVVGSDSFGVEAFRVVVDLFELCNEIGQDKE